jgi:hypothetical protein
MIPVVSSVNLEGDKMKKIKQGMKAKFPGWKGSNRSRATGPYETKPLLFKVKIPNGYVSFSSMKAVNKFIRKMQSA